MRLVTYNIQYSKGKDGRYDLGRIVDALDGADVIALQEVERNWPRTGMADQAAELAALLPAYYWVYGPGFDMDASVVSSDGAVPSRSVKPRRRSRAPSIKLTLRPSTGSQGPLSKLERSLSINGTIETDCALVYEAGSTRIH